MAGMILPKHMKQGLAAAANIQSSSTHRIDSDDWATVTDVDNQIQKLKDYLAERREEEPNFVLPQPLGWKLMVLMITIPEETAGGVFIVEDAREQRSLASPQGVVLSMGQQAYKDPARFDAPWVEIGDRITITKYDAQMFQLGNGQRLGCLNDTQPLSVIDKGWEIPT